MLPTTIDELEIGKQRPSSHAVPSDQTNDGPESNVIPPIKPSRVQLAVVYAAVEVVVPWVVRVRGGVYDSVSDEHPTDCKPENNQMRDKDMHHVCLDVCAVCDARDCLSCNLRGMWHCNLAHCIPESLGHVTRPPTNARMYEITESAVLKNSWMEGLEPSEPNAVPSIWSCEHRSISISLSVLPSDGFCVYV
jgi:hypothetical protein